MELNLPYQRIKALEEELEVAKTEIKRLLKKLAQPRTEPSSTYASILVELSRLRDLCLTKEILHRKHNTPKLHTEFINPALPFRLLDWIAWLEGTTMIGFGETEKVALDDLSKRLERELGILIDCANSALADKGVNRG